MEIRQVTRLWKGVLQPNAEGCTTKSRYKTTLSIGNDLAIPCDLFGMVKSDPFKWLSDTQLGDERDPLNHLV